VYYVRVKTRSSGAASRGSPAQAIDYITDGHDDRREASYDNAEIAYIARMGEGWKTELEGGRVPLHGLGTLAEVEDQAALAAAFEEACQPYHDPRATTGYKSFTCTLPKEVSLLCEGNRTLAQEIMTTAVRRSFDRVLSGLDFSGVTALHTRNECGEIHYHLHVLVSKFAHDQGTGKRFSLNNPKFARLGPQALAELKLAWKEEVDLLVKERLGVTIDQSRRYGPVSLVMPDGVRLEPLNRDSRRLLEMALRPLVSTVGKDGHARASRPFEIKVMDDRIFEVAAGTGGKAGWDVDTFKRLFPEQARFAGRYEKRVLSLQRVGYLTSDGQITPAFRVHYAARKGPLIPELQELRLEIARAMKVLQQPATGGKKPKLEELVRQQRRALQKLGYLGVPLPSGADEPQPKPSEAAHGKAPPQRDDRRDPGEDLWDTVRRLDHLAFRLERLGLKPADVGLAFDEANSRRPTAGVLAAHRSRGSKNANRSAGAFLRGFRGGIVVPRDQETRDLERLGAALAGGGFFSALRQARRGAAPYRPMVKSVPVITGMPPRPAALRRALRRLLPIADFDPRKLIVLPSLAAQARRVAEGLTSTPKEATAVLSRGLNALEELRPLRVKHLGEWKDQPELLTDLMVKQASGSQSVLTPAQYQAALAAGDLGRLLQRERHFLDGGPVDGQAGDVAAELRVLRARLKAFGLGAMLTGPVPSTDPHAVDQVLAPFRERGLISEGPGWALERRKFVEAVDLAESVFPRRTAQLEKDR
jgi:hypothetical protein